LKRVLKRGPWQKIKIYFLRNISKEQKVRLKKEEGEGRGGGRREGA
jgi:hypothetical protein